MHRGPVYSPYRPGFSKNIIRLNSYRYGSAPTVQDEYQISVEGRRITIEFHPLSDLIELYSILKAVQSASGGGIIKILVRSRKGGFTRINDITHYVDSNSFIELDYYLTTKYDRREATSFILADSIREDPLTVTIELYSPLHDLPPIPSRKQTLDDIVDSFKNKYR